MSVLKKYLELLRKFKPGYFLYNTLKYQSLKKNKAHYKKLGITKSLVSSVSHKDIKTKSDEAPWLDVSDAKLKLQNNPGLKSFSPEHQHQLENWIDNGFMILKNFFTEEKVNEMNKEIEVLLQQQKVDYNYTGSRIMDAFKKSELISEAMKNPEILKLLTFALGKEVFLFQTINFFEGSQQNPHSDSYHMTTEPFGFLAAIWVALEDITPEQGPVYYFPGSHKLPYIMNEDFNPGNTSLFLGIDNYKNYEEKIDSLIKLHNLKPIEFTAKKGDVLVWHANLIHGGKPIIKKGATRKSMVGHYFCKDVLCYHEITERPAIIEN